MAMIAASIIDPGLYFAMNIPGSVLGGTVQTASEAVNGFGFQISPQELQSAADSVGEETLVARTGGAPTLAFGISQIFSGFLGGSALQAFWYHFAIMFEALFILTTVDAGTRVARFMLQDTLGNVWKPLGRTSWKPGAWGISAVVVAAWGYFLWVGVNDPLGGVNQLFPVFGISNQLLAAVALTVAVTILIKTGRTKYAWVPGIPLAFDVVNTLSASWQKIFSDNPKQGFFAQSNAFQGLVDKGTVKAPAKSIEDMQQIVTNSFVDGVLVVIFATLIILVLGDAMRVWVRALRGDEGIAVAESEYVESKIVAPSGLIATSEEKAAMANGGHGDRELVGTGGRDGEDDGSERRG